MWGEDYYHNFVNRQALACANQCEGAQLSQSLAFDTSDPRKYKLFIPEIATASRPNVPDGWNVRTIPMVASGEVPIEPPKLERPKWSRDILLNPVFQGPSDRPLVALTIDDGTYNREEVLQTIIRKDVTATFLITGSIMDKDPEFVKKAQASGRITWANHTYDHQSLANMTEAQIGDEYSRTEAALKRITGQTTIPFARPPGGFGTDKSKNDKIVSVGAQNGFRTFLWNVSADAGDQWPAKGQTALANYYMGLVDSYKNPWGSIILMHFLPTTALPSASGAPSALEQVIDGARARGMEPVSLDRLYEGGRV